VFIAFILLLSACAVPPFGIFFLCVVCIGGTAHRKNYDGLGERK
jgi:hypothetical protein